MSDIDRQAIDVAIITALAASAAVKAALGTPPRIYKITPRQAVYPWCMITVFPAPPVARYKPGGGNPPKYVLRHVVEFRCIENVQSTGNVTAAVKAIAVVMDAAPDNLTLAGVATGIVVESIRGPESEGNDPENNGVFAAVEYELQVDV